ncbi:MAG: hypothetical protein E4G98_06905 [Promethearchaeota archaeon]|nr:MAG: hypothetical protein E4G98_06905 [Candidatus Lokiarchaeota archaeon]
MVKILKNNKYFLCVLIISIIFGGLTYKNLPVSGPKMGNQTIDGVTYNFSDYPTLNHEQLGLLHYAQDLLMSEPVNSFDNFYGSLFASYIMFLFAFTEYAMASLFETTPGYRTEAYETAAYRLIEKMNTSEADYGNDSIEYIRWGKTNFDEYYYPNATDPSGVYVGGFRGPANIMWSAHYVLMESLYKRSFNTNELDSEISWFIQDWNNSLQTDGFGNEMEGGIWGNGLIPCEPYIDFVQCNSIAVYSTVLYDNLFGTGYTGMWDFGLNFINTTMREIEGSTFIDGWFIQEPIGSLGGMAGGGIEEIPGPAMDGEVPNDSSYCNAWSMTFLESVMPNNFTEDYDEFIENYRVDVTGDKMYLSGSLGNPGSFGSINDMLGTLFTCILAKQNGDYDTLNRLQNFLNSPYNKVWSEDGREMHYDTSDFIAFLAPVLSVLRIWATTPFTVNDLVTPRPAEFWNYPYISQADDDSIWVYQAQWDPAPEKSAFILNLKVDQVATLTFSNFDHVPTAYSRGDSLGELTVSGSDYTLALTPGSYNLVIK